MLHQATNSVSIFNVFTMPFYSLFFSTSVSPLLYVNTNRQNSVNELDYTFSLVKCKRMANWRKIFSSCHFQL